jgi:hypothetical protein
VLYHCVRPHQFCACINYQLNSVECVQNFENDFRRGNRNVWQNNFCKYEQKQSYGHCPGDEIFKGTGVANAIATPESQLLCTNSMKQYIFIHRHCYTSLHACYLHGPWCWAMASLHRSLIASISAGLADRWKRFSKQPIAEERNVPPDTSTRACWTHKE